VPSSAVAQAKRGLGFAGGIIGVDTFDPVAALTFDDGPCRASTPAILDVLGTHGAQATFFMLGDRARRDPELVAEVAARGHVIGVHGWDHDSIVRDAPAGAAARVRWRRDQRTRTLDALGPVGSRLYRPPFGHATMASRIEARLNGCTTVMWTFGGRDWIDQPPSPTADRVEARLKPGSIIVLHDALYDACGPRPALCAALSIVLERHEEYQWLTVPAMLARGVPRFGFRFGASPDASVADSTAHAEEPCHHDVSP